MKIIPNRFRLVLCCALFNLLFEYSARGIREFINRPLFILALFGIYLTYFLMLEDLMVRFKLTNDQIFLVAFMYGLLPIVFLTKNLFNPNIYWGIMVAGVNVGTVLIVGILAWGVVQGMITLYLANRLTPRDWNHPRMGVPGWTITVTYQVVVMIAAQFNPQSPRGNWLGYLVFLILEAIALALLLISIRTTTEEARPFEPSTVMDVLAFASIVIYFCLGTFLSFGPTIVTSQPLNAMAVKLENVWVIICGVVFFIYRFIKRADVTV